MTSSKKIFLIVAAIFLLLLGYVSYDISRKTTSPGSKPQLQERLKENYKTKEDLQDTTHSESQ